ncbi:MAG: NUDIX hydrolase [Candidatus ainarchaeum sp.]|nr:NUDIX hydrolase [Candidatus ainarchaeum sp.]
MNYRRGVSAFILNDKKEFILVLDTKGKTKELDYWKIPAGGIENNETEEETLIRELKEELDIENNEIKIIGKSKFIDELNWSKETSEKKFKSTGIWRDGQRRTVFIVKLLNQNKNFKLQENEVLDIIRVNKNNFKKYINNKIQLTLMNNIINEFKEYF